jgi:hypothetical protein
MLRGKPFAPRHSTPKFEKYEKYIKILAPNSPLHSSSGAEPLRFALLRSRRIEVQIILKNFKEF